MFGYIRSVEMMALTTLITSLALVARSEVDFLLLLSPPSSVDLPDSDLQSNIYLYFIKIVQLYEINFLCSNCFWLLFCLYVDSATI